MENGLEEEKTKEGKRKEKCRYNEKGIKEIHERVRQEKRRQEGKCEER